MSKQKVMTNEELQELLTKHLRDEDSETISSRKTAFIGAAKMLTSVKLDMEAATAMGKGYFNRTKRFLGEEE